MPPPPKRGAGGGGVGNPTSWAAGAGAPAPTPPPTSSFVSAARGGGVHVAVVAHPGAREDRLSRTATALHVRTTARPTDGEANAAVTATVAKALRMGKSGVTVVRGATARHKVLLVAGAEEAAVRAALEAAVEAVDGEGEGEG